MPTTNGKIYLGSVLISGGGVFVGAKVPKTNQTTSFATDDDGDLQEGRDVDFFTLATNNPFGNANRFTALDGSQTYANDIIIDWSTYEGNIVLGYYRGSITVARLWDDALTWAAGLNPSGYTGWRLTNIKELLNLANYDFGGQVTIYPPVNLVTNSFWSSTTAVNDSTRAYTMTGGTGVVSASSVKATASGVRTLACRNFTVTGTTLT
jgi:hypothetical protein